MSKDNIIADIQADVQTCNGRMYPRLVLEQAVEKYQEEIDGGYAFLYCAAPDFDKLYPNMHMRDLKDVCGKVTKISLNEEGFIICQIKECGINNHMFSIVSSVNITGTGTVDEVGVIENYTICGLHLGPSVAI